MLNETPEITRHIVSVCTEEVIRQQKGYEHVGYMLKAYRMAHTWAATGVPLTSYSEINVLAYIVEPSNRGDFRRTPVTFANGTTAIDAQNVPNAMTSLFRFAQVVMGGAEIDIRHFVKDFLDIHPYTDGNGRTAFLLYNWLRNSFDNPKPLPNFYGEE